MCYSGYEDCSFYEPATEHHDCPCKHALNETCPYDDELEDIAY